MDIKTIFSAFRTQALNSCFHEKVCNTLSLSAYTCSTADGSLILIISITQMICFFWPKIWKWILPIQWLSFSITFFWDFICCVSLLWELGQNHAFWMCNQKQANMSTLLFFLHFITPHVHVHLLFYSVLFHSEFVRLLTSYTLKRLTFPIYSVLK